MKSLHKVSQILDCFSAEQPRLGLNDIAVKTKLPRTTVHRVLSSLKEIGLIVQDRNRDDYRLGLRFLSLGGVILSDLDVPKHAHEQAAALMHQTGEAVHICVFDGVNVVSVDRHEMDGNRNEVVRLEREPPYCTGTGKAILAELPAETARMLVRKEWQKFTGNTITREDVLFNELAVIRARGYSVDDEERQLGIRCVGAAIRHQGRVVGAISVTGPKQRFPESRIPVLAGLVTAAAARISLSIEQG